MPASTPPITRTRAIRVGVTAAIVAAHVGLFSVLAISLPRDKPVVYAPPPDHLIDFIPQPPPKRLRKQPRAEHGRASAPVVARAVPGRAVADAVRSGVGVPQASVPAGPRAIGDPYAEREALQSSVGCDLDQLKLRPDQRDRCAEHAARWARRAQGIGPAADDPKRAAELQAEEAFARKMHDYKAWGGGSGPCGMLDMTCALGPMPPKK